MWGCEVGGGRAKGVVGCGFGVGVLALSTARLEGICQEETVSNFQSDSCVCVVNVEGDGGGRMGVQLLRFGFLSKLTMCFHGTFSWWSSPSLAQ